MASVFVLENLCALKLICDKSTPKHIVTALLTKSVISTIIELLINSKHTPAVKFLKDKKLNIDSKKKYITLKVRELISPLVDRLHGEKNN